MPKIDDYEDQLLSAIRTAVRETEIEDDRAVEILPVNDMQIDYIETLEDGSNVYDVWGSTYAMIQSQLRESGDYYEPPTWDEEEIDCSVNFKVITHPDSDSIDVDVVEVIMEDVDDYFEPELDEDYYNDLDDYSLRDEENG